MVMQDDITGYIAITNRMTEKKAMTFLSFSQEYSNKLINPKINKLLIRPHSITRKGNRRMMVGGLGIKI